MEHLEKYFDTAFGASDGINQLRGLILTIALQGKLVPQDPHDQSSHEVLQSIKLKHKDKYAELTKSNKRTSSVNQDSVPYEIPKNWKWVTLSEIGVINPRNIANENLDAGFVPMPLIKAKYGVPHSFEVRKWKLIRSGYTHFSNGDTGLAKITPCFENGKSCVFNNLPNGIGAGTTELHIFRNTFELVEPDFLLAYFKSPKFISDGTKKMTGSAGQKRVPTDYFSTNPFPLPPIKEQQRIVKKIDKLMSRCDELEKLRSERDQKRLVVHTAAIRKMLDAPDQETFDDAWQFITRHFGDLYTVRENVTELRKAILQLAVMGKLVPQDPKEGTARELLEEIEREKRRMVKEGKRKEPKSQPPINSEEIPFEVPKGWEWVRLRTISYDLGQKTPSSNFTYFDVGSIDNINGIVSDSVQCLKSTEAPSRARKIVKKGTVIYSTVRPYLMNIAIIEKHYEPEPIASTAFAVLHPYKGINNRYLYYYLRSPIFIAYVENLMKGVAYPAINDGDLFIGLMPLPPNAEQNRIAYKIEHLYKFCDILETQIYILQSMQAQVLGATISALI